MKYYSIPLTLALTACGTPSSSPSDPASQDCRNNRIWDETQNQCIESTQDATLEDAIIEDAGYVQKYQGTLYGVINSNKNNIPPQFVTYHFSTGKLESLVDVDDNIIDLPFDRGIIYKAAMSLDGNHIIFNHRNTSSEPYQVYLLNIQNNDIKTVLTNSTASSFSWKDNSHYFMSISEQVNSSDNGNKAWKTRLYEKSVDGIFSDWIIEQETKFEMNITAELPSTSSSGIAFTCINQTGTFLELCRTTNTPYHGEFSYKSQDLHFPLDASVPMLYWPHDPSGSQIVYFGCSDNTTSQNNLCSYNLYSNEKKVLIQAENQSPIRIVTFSPDGQYILIGQNQIFARQGNTFIENIMPMDTKLDGKPVEGSIQWIVWRED